MSIFIHRNLDIFGTMTDQEDISPLGCLRVTEYNQNKNKIKYSFTSVGIK